MAAGQAPPRKAEQEDFPKLVGVLDTNDNFALASACTALDEAGIMFDVVAISDLPDSLKTLKLKWWVAPSRILVSMEDEEDARKLVEQFQQPLPDQVDTVQDIAPSASQQDITSPESFNTNLSGGKFLLFGGTNAPLAQRIGAWIIGAFFIAGGLSFLEAGRREGSFVGKFFSLGTILLGAKVFRNGFLKGKRNP